MRARSRLLGGAVLLFAVVVAVAAIRPNPTWTPDGYGYSIRMQMDAGIPFDRARRASQAFYAQLPAAKVPQFAPLFVGNGLPQYWTLFSVRIVYPAAAALLWHARGFQSLLDVSLIAYVAAVLGVYWLSLQFVRPEFAALAAIYFGIFPETRYIASCALTDMPATALAVVTLAAMCSYVVRRTLNWFAAYAVFAMLLSLTRPLAFIPLAAAATLGVDAMIAGRRDDLGRAAQMAAVAICCGALLAGLAALNHAPSFHTVMLANNAEFCGAQACPRSASPNLTFLYTVAYMTARWIHVQILMVVPVLAFGGIIVRWKQPGTPLLLGTWLSGFLAIALNPLPNDLWRTVVLLLLPVTSCAAVMALEELMRVLVARVAPSSSE